MKRLIFILLFSFFLFGCEKESFDLKELKTVNFQTSKFETTVFDANEFTFFVFVGDTIEFKQNLETEKRIENQDTVFIQRQGNIYQFITKK